ncbi:MAG TPA: PQQ-binding-like beta-propeller repeat protein [Gemmatimonadaceae bacterium]|nr:PQQ-binding-like beta-propeller repeat protein [Gemmatimonadaceae bacterium]
MQSIVVTFGMTASIVASARAQDVPMFRGDLAHTGVYSAAGVTREPTVKWAFRTQGRVISTPAVVANVAYFGSTDGNVYAVDAATGALRWKFATEARVASSPAVDGGIVYVESYDGNFYAIDAATGKLSWKFAVPGERRFAGKYLHGHLPAGETMPDPFDLYLSSPAVWRGAVYFGSGDGHVYALDAKTGRVRWKFRTGNVVHASPAIANGTLFIGSWDSWFYALDAATGKQRWRFKTGEDTTIANQVGIQSSAAVADGVVYFGCRDGHLYAVDAATGVRRWAFDTKGAWVNSSPAVRDGKVYVATADERKLHELDAKTGTPTFSLQFSWYFFASPAVAGNMVYAANWDGKLNAIDLTTRQVAWVFQTDSSRANLAKHVRADGSMAFRAGNPEAGFYDGLVMAIDRIFGMGSFLSSPVVVGNTIYIGSMDGNLYALQ